MQADLYNSRRTVVVVVVVCVNQTSAASRHHIVLYIHCDSRPTLCTPLKTRFTEYHVIHRFTTVTYNVLAVLLGISQADYKRYLKKRPYDLQVNRT